MYIIILSLLLCVRLAREICNCTGTTTKLASRYQENLLLQALSIKFAVVQHHLPR